MTDKTQIKFIRLIANTFLMLALIFGSTHFPVYAQTDRIILIQEVVMKSMVNAIRIFLDKTAPLSEDQLEVEMEDYLIELINGSRTAYSKPILIRETRIDGVAKNWSEIQASYQVSTHNTNLGYDLIDADVPFLGYGENIGYGVVTDPNNKQEFLNILKVIHNGMMAEQPPYDGHKRTILGEDVEYSYIGVGIEVEGKKFWLTTDYVM